MDSQPNRGIALLSIRPQYAEAIISGKKKTEFRRVGFRREVSAAIIYASSPVQKILGYFSITGIEESEPDALWPRHRMKGQITYEEFKKYFDGAEKGVAISVGEVFYLREPVSLSDLSPAISPPQSFLYVSAETFDSVRRLSRKSPTVVP